MIVLWGKIVGLGLGVFGGLIGAGFGLLVGHLLDVVAAEFLLRRALVRFLAGRHTTTWRQFDPAVAVAALAVVSVVGSDWHPSSDDGSAFKLSVNTWAHGSEKRRHPRWWIRMGRGRAARYLDAALRLRPDIDLESVALRVDAEIPPDDRAKVIEICRSTLESEVRGPVLDRLRILARLIDLSDEWIHAVLSAAAGSGRSTGIDAETCEILGVESDADLATVKQAYRRLAAQFHPDTATGLSTEQQEASSAAFVRIRSAYDRVVTQLTEDR